MFQFVLKQGREMDVPRSFLTKLNLFKKKPELMGAGRYAINCEANSDVFALFVTRLYGGESDVGVTSENAEQLLALCEELGFTGFDDELRAVLGHGVDSEVRKDFVTKQDVLIEDLQSRILELESRL